MPITYTRQVPQTITYELRDHPIAEWPEEIRERARNIFDVSPKLRRMVPDDPELLTEAQKTFIKEALILELEKPEQLPLTLDDL